MGIEPTQPAWKAGILPLNYTRKKNAPFKCLVILACNEKKSQRKYMFGSNFKGVNEVFTWSG